MTVRIHSLFATLLVGAMLCVVVPVAAQAASFHDQPPMTNVEIERFCADFPAFKQFMYENRVTGKSAHPVVDKDGNPSFRWDEKVLPWFEGRDWTPERFFYVMTHCSAAMSMVRMGDKVTGANRPKDMPLIGAYELNLVRQYEGQLLEALSAGVKKTLGRY